MQCQSVGWDNPLEEGMAIHSSILSREPHGQGSLAGYKSTGSQELETTKVTQHAHKHTLYMMLFLSPDTHNTTGLRDALSAFILSAHHGPMRGCHLESGTESSHLQGLLWGAQLPSSQSCSISSSLKQSLLCEQETPKLLFPVSLEVKKDIQKHNKALT